MKKIVRLFAVFCLPFLAIPAWSQGNMCHVIDSDTEMCTNYVMNTPITTSTNATVAKTVNAWYPMPGSPIVAGTAQGHDTSHHQKHYFVTSAGAVWEYVDEFAASNQNTWVQHPEFGTDITQLAYGYGALWKLRSSTTGCTGGGHLAQYWNGSAWANPTNGICATELSVADSDATVYAIRYGGAAGSSAYYYNGSGFAAIQGGPYVSIAGINSCTALMTDAGDTKLWERYQCTGTAVQQLALAAPSSNGKIRVAPVNELPNTPALWFLAAAGTTSYSYLGGTSWNAYIGSTITSVGSCGPLCTFAIANGGNVFRFSDIGLVASVGMTGNTTCTNHLGGSKPCPTSTHTPAVTAKWGSYSLTGGRTTTGPAVTPETQVNVTAQDTIVDPFQCLDQGLMITACLTPSGPAPETGGAVTCSLVGPIFGDGPGNYPGLPYSCYIPNLGGSWSVGQQVTVYFDPRPLCYSNQPCYTVTAGDGNAKSVFYGISLWTGLTDLATTYTQPAWDGVLCTREGLANMPCHVSTPFIFVSSLSGGNVLQQRSSGDDFTVMYFDQNTLNAFTQAAYDRLKSVAAHEEGHDQRLDDCCPVDGSANCTSGFTNGCTASAFSTVMWGSWFDGVATVPTVCDILNSDLGVGLNFP